MKSIFNKIKYYFEKQKLFNRVSLEQSNFSILDTETTGLNVSKGDKVISVASLKINNFKIQEDLFLDELVNPQIKISRESTKIHHIKDEDVRDKPTLIEIGIVVSLLLAGGYLEFYMIELAQQEGLMDMPGF